MYFDPTPKKQKTDLFGFEKEYSQLKNALEGPERFIVIKGLRRTGKTSLMTVIYNELKLPKIFIDMRELVPRSQENFARHFYLSAIETISSIDFLKTVIGKIKSIDIGIKISLRDQENTISILLKMMNEELTKKGKTMVLFIDEAQLMKPILADNLFAYIYDHLEHIQIVFAGSEIGVLEKMLNEEKNALFGRPYLEIATEPIDEEKARLFLSTGFKQTGYRASKEEIARIIEKTNGIIGWLTLAGYYISNYKNLEQGLQKTETIAKKIISSELDNFFENRKTAKRKYLGILKLLSKQSLSWADIKRGFEAKFGKISNNRFTEYLHTLKEYSFISQKEKRYYITDRLLAHLLS